MKNLFAVLLLVTMSAFTYAQNTDQQKLHDQTVLLSNNAVELAYKDLSLRQMQDQLQLEKDLAPFQQKLTEAINAARKLQGLSDEFQYNMASRKFEKPAPPQSPAGTPVKKPENTSENKK